ncbi:MAG: acyl-CoA/acyl-ACP dehydrogenase [Deltaproteobacteria bacterium]|jgi:alkylation response protein AidB-like acyl-CoA dehydrogenase|nr:acyl-CoA/acyl-ACP dehydrogenase [Deltaproteobacteria bacterium]
MLFEFSDEHGELRRTVRDFCEKESDENRVRELMSSEQGYDPKCWSRMAEELGIVGLIVSEKHGGADLGMVELAIVAEEMGRVLLCAPYLSSAVLATSALELAADEAAQNEILPKLASGEAIGTLAFSEPAHPWELSKIAMTAEADGSAFALSGEKSYVLDGSVASEILVAARAGAELALFRVAPDASGLSREALPPLDQTRRIARLRFDRTPATRISSGDISDQLNRALDRAIVALAAEQLGGAQRVLEMATEYAKTRFQFGRPIGSFQIIKHQCADMLVAVELARSAVYNAAFASEEDPESVSIAAQMAKSYCSDAYLEISNRNIQVHGGMGFTWEHGAHLYFKRAKASEVLFGSPSFHRERMAHSLGFGAR